MDRSFSDSLQPLNISGSSLSSQGSQDAFDTPGSRKKRGAYLCSKCGEPKKGHVCKVKLCKSRGRNFFS